MANKLAAYRWSFLLWYNGTKKEIMRGCTSIS